jgi:spore coat protein U-like protein
MSPADSILPGSRVRLSYVAMSRGSGTVRAVLAHRPGAAHISVAALASSVWMSIGPAAALTAGPANFAVGATLATFCTVSATSVAFGSVNAGAAAANTAARVTLACNKGATVSRVALNNGSNATGTQKRMRNPVSGDFLNYRIDRPTGATFSTCPVAGAGPEWNNANRIVATSLFTTTGGPKQINICASIPAAQYPTAGNYSDTVQVTATYN